MYSQELQTLIEAILADGQLSPKELAVLRKRALAENEDPDEVEVYVEGLLAKKNNSSEISTPPPLPADLSNPRENHTVNKYGHVRKCPNCGATIEGAIAKCPQCDFVFTEIEAVDSRKKFSEMIQKIDSDTSIDEMKDMKRANAVKTFPVPNSKEDLLEFMFFLRSATQGYASRGESKTRNAYRQKLKECCDKAQFYFGDDPKIKQIIDKSRRDAKGKLFTTFKDNANLRYGCIFAFVWLFLLLLLFGVSE